MLHQDVRTLENPLLEGIALPPLRSPEKPSKSLPVGLEIVSADGHWDLSEDIFYQKFPEKFKDRAPRVWFEKSLNSFTLGSPDSFKSNVVQIGEMAREMLSTHYTRGLYDFDERIEHMDANGITKEILFPQLILMYLNNGPTLDIREDVFRIFNEHLAEKTSRFPGRVFGVGVCANWWEPSRMAGAVRQIVDLGLKTFMLPNSPGKNASGKEITYGSEDMEPLWAAAEEAGLPVCFHIAESLLNIEGRGVLGGFLMSAFTSFRKSAGQLIFGGVFDRHPDLKVVFAEGGIGWVPPALQDAEAIYDSYLSALKPALKHRPSYYWHNNCYATFQSDRLGLGQLDIIGADRIMWANDYPHPEGTHGLSHSSMQQVLDMTPEPIARKILGDTARAVFKI